MLDGNGNVLPDADPQSAHLLLLEHENNMACDYLTLHGFDGTQLRLKAPRKRQQLPPTAPHTKERLDAINATKFSGQLFHATGGEMLNSSDMFRAKAMAFRKKEMEELEARLNRFKKHDSIYMAASMLLMKKGELTMETQNKFMKYQLCCDGNLGNPQGRKWIL
jgi:hypothetical protein